MKKFRIWALIFVAMLMLTVTGCKEDVQIEQTAGVFQDGDILGEGEKEFEFSVTYGDGKTESCTVKTDKEIVGEALSELSIISGEDGAYGLYVKSVNGAVADYDKDGTYWAFYIDGEYATSGVDKTSIEDGKEYSFKVEK